MAQLHHLSANTQPDLVVLPGSQLVTPTRLNSLWQQLKWLQSHPEHANGGNHWLENLMLSLGGLQFVGRDALAMHNSAMNLLQKELAHQVLGGHEERSASYHLLISIV